MKPKRIKRFFAAELENKKVYYLNFSSGCDLCLEPMEDGDPFFWWGDGKKVCEACVISLQEFVEELA